MTWLKNEIARLEHHHKKEGTTVPQLYVKNPVTGEFEPVEETTVPGTDPVQPSTTPFMGGGTLVSDNIVATPNTTISTEPTSTNTPFVTAPSDRTEAKPDPPKDAEGNEITVPEGSPEGTVVTAAGVISTPVPQEAVDAMTPPLPPGEQETKVGGVWVEGVNADGVPILTYTPK